MAFPSVTATAVTNGSTSTTQTVINLPAASSGQLLLIVVRVGSTGTITEPSGWTVLASNQGSQNGGALVLAKTATGSEGSTLTVTQSGGRGAAIAMAISNHDGSYAVMTLSSGYDSPNLSPGLGVKDFLWIAYATTRGVHTLTSAPTGYSDALTGTSGTGVEATVFTSTKLSAAASEDPSAWSISGSSLSNCGVVGIVGGAGARARSRLILTPW